jgi:hypothetical protein
MSGNRVVLRMVLRIVVVVGLGYDVYSHWHLAPNFDSLKGNGKPISISQGELFRLETALALVAMVLVAVIHRRWTAAFAFVVAFAGVAAVVLYRYVDVGALGPIPDMYDAAWYAEKTWSAIAEGAAAIAAAWLFFVEVRPRDNSREVVRPRAASS